MSDEDDKIKRGLQHIFSPDWANNAGKRVGEAAKEAMPVGHLERLRAAARRYVDFIRPEEAAAREELARQEARRATEAEQNALIEEHRRAMSGSASEPAAGGEIDAQRPAVSFQREFSNDAEKEAYLERIRQAQANAAKK